MSKGAIRVHTHLARLFKKNNKQVIHGFYRCDNRFILKRNILHIERFSSYYDLWSWLYETGTNSGEPMFDKSKTAIELAHNVADTVDCTCGVYEHTKTREQEMNLREWCKCPLPIYPLYLIQVKNKFVTEEYALPINGGYGMQMPDTVLYIVHPDEREHMERFLAGTDDALYDYVHHLKYDPLHGTEVQAAKQEYEALAKKQKTGE